MGSEAVKVIVRCRPINGREERLSCEVILTMETSVGQVQLRKPKNAQAAPKFFTFDGVYYMKDTTQQIYEEICFPLVEGVLQGFNGTVFAYGQTGCGKSYTMMGVEDPPENKGIIPRAFDHVFDQVAVEEDMKYMVQASYLEIYNEEVRDLLGRDVKKKLELHEHPEKGIYVQGLSHHKVLNVHDLERVMELGSKNRSVGATLMNVDSSRSHSIFTINIEMMEVSEGRLKCGRLNLVDLAGSERQSKTGSTGERLKEATKINLSLSALGNVISALVDGRSTHIPYRDSKLTRLLQSSLGGNTKTLMIACVSPADNNFDETLSTLRYANRAKNIKNKPRINEDPKDALLREYREEIERLKQLLLGQGGIPQEPSGIPQEPSGIPQEPSETLPPPPPQYPSAAQLQALEEEKEAIRLEYEAKIAELREQFSKEQSDRAGLQEELGKLQKAFDEQLAAAQERHIPASETLQHLPGVALPPAPAPMLTPAPTHITPSQGALPSHSQLVPGGGGRPVDGDRVAVPPAPAPTHITSSQGTLPSHSQLVPGGGGRPVDGERVAVPPAPAPTHITSSQGALPSHSQLVPGGGGRPVDRGRVVVTPAPAPTHITSSQGALPSHSQLVPGGGGRPVDRGRVVVTPAPAPTHITPSQGALPSHSQLVPGGGGRPVDGDRVAVPPAPAPTHITPSQGALPSHSQLVPGGGGRPVDGDRVAVLPAPAPTHITPSQGALPSHSQLVPGGGGWPVDGERVAVPPAPAPTHITPSQGALPSHSQLVPGGGGRPVDGDREILRQHEQALQRLEELQKGMIGGERAGDEGLKQQLQQRRKRADERLEALRHASSELEDDGIIERIFNSLTDEVRVKTKLLERTQAKAKSAEEDIKDLSAEFEIDRQDYLDTIRKQERTIKLQQQLLETIVPCLRRDCNYYNLDKVRSECVWDEDQLEWVLPKLITTRTNLAHIDSGSTLGERRSASTSKLPRHGASSNETQIQSPPSVVSNLPPPNHVQASAYDPPESDRYLAHLHRSAEPNYFKPKRYRELLAQSAQMKGSGAAEKADVLGKGGNLQPVTVTAAAIHGVDSRIIGDSSYSRRPGKLQSLSINPTLPQNLPPITDSHILDKVEKRLSNRKRNSLEPLQDKHRKPPM